MAHNALVNIMIRKPNLKPLLDMLFGRDGSRRGQISIYFTIFSQLSSDDDFVVICGDEMVNLITNLSQWTNLRQWDPQIAWVDHDHHWIHHHDGYRPCDPARRPDSPDPLPRAFTVRAFTIRARLIYLCPVVLDNPKGRLLAPYKDRLLAGEHIDDYALTSFILFHELLHTNIITPLDDGTVRKFPPSHVYRNNPSLAYDKTYQISMPMVPAYGLFLYAKLGKENPDGAVRNADNVALCALGLYLDKNNWLVPRHFGCAQPF